MVAQIKLPKEQKRIGAEIQRRREDAGMTQSQLAEKVGLTAGQIGHIEVGRHWPSLPAYIMICRVLGMPEPK